MEKTLIEKYERPLRISEVSVILGVSDRTVYRWCEEGSLKAHRIGRLWFIPRTSLKVFLEPEDQSDIVGIEREVVAIPA